MRKTNISSWFSSLFLMALLSGITGLAYADTFIDTIPSWIGIGVNPFGPAPDTETYGQTVTVPLTDPVLLSWTFYMKQDTATQFWGEVYAWNGLMAISPSLFESAMMTTTDPDVFQAITFGTGGLALTPGGTYVLFASSKDAQSGGGGTWGIVPGSSYTGGAFFHLNKGTDASQWTTGLWKSPGDYDLAFKADFDSPAAVPEPSSRILLATVLGAMFVLTRLGRKVPHA